MLMKKVFFLCILKYFLSHNRGDMYLYIDIFAKIARKKKEITPCLSGLTSHFYRQIELRCTSWDITFHLIDPFCLSFYHFLGLCASCSFCLKRSFPRTA